MKIAKLIGLNGEGKQELYGTMWMANGTVVGDTRATERLLSKPLHYGGRDYTASDGEAFLDILPHAVSGAYMQAVVEDVQPETPSRQDGAEADMFAMPGRPMEPVRHARPSHPPITPLMRELAEQAKRTPKE